MKKLISFVLVFTVLMSAAVFAPEAAAKTRTIKGGFNYSYAQKVLKLTNKNRKKRGVKALKLDAALTKQAMARAAELVIMYSHTRPNKSQCSTAYNWTPETGENMSHGFETPAKVMKGWMDSPGHRQNILRKGFSRVGIGCFRDSYGGYHWIQAFSGGSCKKTCKTKSTKYAAVKVPLKASGKSKVTYAKKVKKIKTAKLSKTKFEYTGKAPKYSVIVKDAKGKNIPKNQYQIEYPRDVNRPGDYYVYVIGLYTAQRFKVKLSVQPPAPTINSVKPTSDGYTVSWDFAGGNSYMCEVEYSTNKDFSDSKMMPVFSENSYEMLFLEYGTDYYVRVRSYVIGNNGFVYSDWSKVYTFKTDN